VLTAFIIRAMMEAVITSEMSVSFYETTSATSQKAVICNKILVKKRKGGDYLGDLHVDIKIILKWILKRVGEIGLDSMRS
jgi:hypothetical protein